MTAKLACPHWKLAWHQEFQISIILVPKFKNKNLNDRLRYKKNGRGVHFSFNKIG